MEHERLRIVELPDLLCAVRYREFYLKYGNLYREWALEDGGVRVLELGFEEIGGGGEIARVAWRGESHAVVYRSTVVDWESRDGGLEWEPHPVHGGPCALKGRKEDGD